MDNQIRPDLLALYADKDLDELTEHSKAITEICRRINEPARIERRAIMQSIAERISLGTEVRITWHEYHARFEISGSLSIVVMRFSSEDSPYFVKMHAQNGELTATSPIGRYEDQRQMERETQNLVVALDRALRSTGEYRWRE